MNRMLAAVSVAFALVIAGGPALAGTAASPEIADAPGDANFLSTITGSGQDTRPASLDNADLRAVWFETAYSTTKVLDPTTGAVLRVEYRPTALVVHIQTQGPVRPVSPWSALRFKVQATLPECQASFELLVAAATQQAEIRSVGTQCGDLPPSTAAVSPITPQFDGAVSTMSFPLDFAQVSQFVSAGTVLSQPRTQSFASLPTGILPTAVDGTAAGPDFTIAQDVPADIDCTTTPDSIECQP